MTTVTEQSPRCLTSHELAGVVRAFREMRGWSQEQLAEISRVSGRTVQRVEEGKESSVDTRRALASAFGSEDLDVFNKPYVFPTAEELAAQQEQFEKEHVRLKAEKVVSGKQLASLVSESNALLFSEGSELSGEAEEAFAELSDFCREYADCHDLYTATSRLEVHDSVHSYLSSLAKLGVGLAAAKRSEMFSMTPESQGIRMDILYVAAFKQEAMPESFAVKRKVQFG